ncbi:MAG: hypothetical protein HEQ09_09280 [Dolichospermum sp. UKL202]
MPTVTINIAGHETPLADGTKSSVGHMWYSLTDSNGNKTSYGFSPDREHGSQPFAPGAVNAHGQDDSYYMSREYSKTINITQAQYDAMKNFGDKPQDSGFSTYYNGLSNSCIDFTWKALEKAGLNPSGFQGDIWPTHNIDDVKNIVNKSFGVDPQLAITLGLINARILRDASYMSIDDIITDLQNQFNQAQTITSPIILDLDGNGVDTISKSAGIHFDLDGNKFAETTGWVGKNDGLLVLDKNGNGKIDNGTELFGNNTLLKNGTKAANGFVALAELDNNKDGKIDASDTAYNQLRVWKDSNSNGLADTGELLTLTQAGVKSLNTGYTNQTQTDAQGNQHLQVGNYTRTDGSTRAMNDVWFATDNARTIDQDIVTVNATIAALPELQGFGNVRSLQQAIARDTSGKLQTLVTQFSSTTDTTARHTLLDQILLSWTGADQYAVKSRGDYATDGRKIYAIEAFLGQRFVQGSGTNQGLNDPGPFAAAALQNIYDKLHQVMYAKLMAQTQFKSLYNSINLSWNSTTNQFDIDVSATVTALQTKYTADATAGAALILDFGNNLKTTGDFGQQVLATLQKQGNIAGQGFAFSLATMGYNTINGTANNDTLNGINGKDNWLVGNGGNDNISGGNGNDIIDRWCRK